MGKIIDEVDVICDHKSDGSIIPLRLRFMNEDGEYETFNIKGYRQVTNKGSYTTEDGLYITGSTFLFECMIIAMNSRRIIRLYYEPSVKTKWRLAI